jgi:O-antigen/teichoic acid export membrane protein
MPPIIEVPVPAEKVQSPPPAVFLTLARNIVASFGSLFLRVGTSFILTPYLVLSLGKEHYGIWTLCLSFSLSGMFSLLSFGFQGGLVKYVAEYHALARFRELNEVFTATLAIFAGTAAVGAAVLAGCAGLLAHTVLNVPPGQGDEVRILLTILSLQLLFELPALAAEGVVAGMQRFDLLGYLEMGRFLVLSALIVLVLQVTHSLVYLGFAAAGVAVAYSVLLAILAKKLLPELRVARGVSREVLLRMLRFTGDLFLLRINAVVYNNMDGLLIGTLVATSAVTDYDIANRVHGIVVMVMGIAPMVVLPAASSFAGKQDADSLRTLVVTGTKVTMALTLPLCLTVGVLAEEIIRFWISPAFVGDAVLVRLFLVYLLFWPIQGIGWNMLVGVGETATLTRMQMISVAVNLAVTVVLLHYIGIAGAMIGTVVGNLVAFFPNLRLILRRFDVEPRKFWSEAVLTTYPLALAVAALLALVVRVRPADSLIEVAGYAVVSLAAFFILFAVTGMSRSERNLLLGFVCARVPK